MDDSIIIISSDEEDFIVKPIKTEILNPNDKKDAGESTSLPEKIIETNQNKRKTDSTELETCSISPKKQKHNNEENNENSDGDCSAEVIVEPSSSDSSVLSEFISTCLKLDSSPEMTKILNRKIKKYYSLLSPDYQKSEQFYTLLERKQAEIVRCPSHLYRHLKEVTDEFNLHRTDKIKTISKPNASDRFIRKLCKSMELLHRKIKILEEKEVDWDEEEDSSYLQLQRYRERLIKVHNKLQELEGNTKTIFKRKISFSGTKFPSINRAVEKFVNVKGEFPDYHDIVDLLKNSYASESIEVSPSELKFQAKSVFQNVGEQLQRQRQYECWEAHSTFLETDNDPAEEIEELRSALEENKRKHGFRIDEVINTFAEKHRKSQCTSEDSNSLNGVNQTLSEKKEENLNGSVDVEEEKTEGGDVKGEESEERRKGSESEHCEERDGNDCSDDGGSSDDHDKEDEEREEGEEEEDDDDDDNDDEEANGEESVADILNDLDGEQTTEFTEELFLYHGPVSPPNNISDHELNIDGLSPLPSPVDFNIKTKNGEPNSEIKKSPDNMEISCIADEEKVPEPTRSCSKLKDSDEPIRTSLGNPKENSETKPFLKVKPLSALLGKTEDCKQNEILLD